LPPGGPSGLHENQEFGFRPAQSLFSLLAVTTPRRLHAPMLKLA